MRRILLIFLFLGLTANAQTNTYSISFENAKHHEAKVKATFPNITDRVITLRMSRSSPGRYALHEFAKNVYGLRATDSHGNELEVTRPDPYSWKIKNGDGTINVEYALFANHGDGTYSQVDESHAHLNIPATFIYAEDYQDRPIEVNFDVREDLNWKVATQLKKISATKYSAPNLYYFMDSPTEISDYRMRSFELNGQTIRFALHHEGTEAELDEYFEQVKKIVKQEQAVYGELPDYDYGKYTFIVCYMPNVDGDGMEHRNSTIITSTRSLANGGMKKNLGTVAHEYFHCWNVERIRPDGLEPFDFSRANMSGCLWFAEGFTSYYDGLIRCRANITSPEEYIDGLQGTFNYVWNSPAHKFFNPIEMSYQAPFVDAATSVDPVNRENTFISYYSYGSILGLALDLSLREKDLSLDDFMKRMWGKYGKTEVAYDVKDIETTLEEFAGKKFADDFFNNYIYGSKMPDYNTLFKDFGISLNQKEKAFFGASVKKTDDGLQVSENTVIGTPAYEAGLDKGDIITSINGNPVTTSEDFKKLIEEKAIGENLEVEFKRYNKTEKTTVTLQKSPSYYISLDEKASREAARKREKWLEAK